MSLRKLRHVNRGLLWIAGTPDSGALCVDCRDHPARVQIHRRTKRGGSSYAIKSRLLLRLCETCALELVEQFVGMLQSLTRHRIDAELSLTTAARVKIDRDTGNAAQHDRRVRARIQRLKRDELAQNARRA